MTSEIVSRFSGREISFALRYLGIPMKIGKILEKEQREQFSLMTQNDH